MEMVEDVVIVGAGIAGLATAVALKRAGIRSLVLEKAEELRTTGSALTLLPNAWLALDTLGVSHKLTSLYASNDKVNVTNVDSGAVQEVVLGRNNNGHRVVHRKVLLTTLANELPQSSIRFSSKLIAIETQTQEGSSISVIHLQDATTIKAKVLIGCDGVHSVVGRWLGLGEAVDSGRSAVRGLSLYPHGHGLNQVVNQFLAAGIRAGYVPIDDTQVYWFLLCQSKVEELATDPKEIQKEITKKFAKNFPEKFKDIVENSDLSTLSWAPLKFRYPWQVLFGNLCNKNITVAGDAMHPMTPDLGQGGCSALEDAVVLGRHITTSFIQNGCLIEPKEMPKVLENYVQERKGRVTFLITGSYMSGRVQQGGSVLKFVRDFLFYKFVFPRIAGKVMNYDCGKLPSVPEFGELDKTK
nr:monooxygenase 2-like [Ziziphus jujuba var. spinosa]